MAETILRPQKTFQPVEELDDICCAVQGFAEEAPLGLKLCMAMGLAAWVQGTIRKLCSGGGWLAPKTDKATKRCLQ